MVVLPLLCQCTGQQIKPVESISTLSTSNNPGMRLYDSAIQTLVGAGLELEFCAEGLTLGSGDAAKSIEEVLDRPGNLIDERQRSNAPAIIRKQGETMQVLEQMRTLASGAMQDPSAQLNQNEHKSLC